MNNIILIGMMGAGKTTIGQLLAERLGFDFIDTDDYILEHYGYDSIEDIFASKGEAYFRTLETDVLNDLSSLEDTVIATGGGIILSKENVVKLKKMGKVIYIKQSLNNLLRNLSDSTDRPLLNNTSVEHKIKNLLNQRKFKYIHSANVVFNVKKMTPDEAAKKIMNFCYKLIY